MRWIGFIVTSLFAAALTAAPRPAAAADVICYNCPPHWADWASMLKAIKTDLGLDIPYDNKNSGQALSQLLAERNNPIADIVYFGVTFGIRGKDEGVLQPYKPKGWDDIPAGLKDPDGYWHTIHSGTLGLFVNKDAAEDRALLEAHRFDGKTGFAFVILPRGGDFEIVSAVKDASSLSPWCLAQLAASLPEGTYKVANGEPGPAMLGWLLAQHRFNAYRAKYTEKGSFEFVLPCEGSVVFPYVIGLVKGAPHKQPAEKVLDYILSDKGQAIWTNAYLRPARPIPLPAAVKARFLPDSDYARARTVDWGVMASYEEAFADRYLDEVR